MLKGFLLLAFGLIAGGIVGAYTTTTVYGPRKPHIEHAPVCPPCAEVEACDQPPLEVATEAIEAPDIDAPAVGAGLPAHAIRLASEAFTVEAALCRDALNASEQRNFLLDLTITSTGGVGRVARVRFDRPDAAPAPLLHCIEDAARQTRFEWPGSDGRGKLRYPLTQSGE